MKIIDWKDEQTLIEAGKTIKLEASDLQGIPETIVWARDGKLEEIIFRNFPKIIVREKFLKNCIFEHCGDIAIESCELRNCVFFSIDTINLNDSMVIGSIFQTMCSCYTSPIILTDSELTGCLFTDITLANKSFLCIGHGNSHVGLCTFHNIATDRRDCMLFYYEKLEDNSNEENTSSSFVDTDSCAGLEDTRVCRITCLGMSLAESKMECPDSDLLEERTPCQKK